MALHGRWATVRSLPKICPHVYKLLDPPLEYAQKTQQLLDRRSPVLCVCTLQQQQQGPDDSDYLRVQLMHCMLLRLLNGSYICNKTIIKIKLKTKKICLLL